MRRAELVAALVVAVLIAADLLVVAEGYLTASHRGGDRPVARTVFLGSTPVARVEEHVAQRGAGVRVVSRRAVLSAGEQIQLTAELNEDGVVHDATYRRPGKRELRLRAGRLEDSRSGAWAAVARPPVLLEVLHLCRPRVGLEVTLVDMASGEQLDVRLALEGTDVVARDPAGAVVARVDAAGERHGPGAFHEGRFRPDPDPAAVAVPFAGPADGTALGLLGVDDVLGQMKLEGAHQRGVGARVVIAVTPRRGERELEREVESESERESAGTDALNQVELFLEHNAPAVRAFAARHALGRDALADAAALTNAIHPLVDPARTDEPPSAVRMLEAGGDCDGAAALLVASLRSLGHTARPVVGYRRLGRRFVPHAWAEVRTAWGWMLADATVPQLGASQLSHLKLFEGLGGALTMGRVIGRLALVAADPVP